MNLAEYQLKKQKDLESQKKYRPLCTKCFQHGDNCYCKHIDSFDPFIQFVILIHPIEVKRKVASGRMTHLCLKNSEIIKGEDFSFHPKVNDLLDDPTNQCFILYPGRTSIAISDHSGSDLLTKTKNTVIFVIDGTWATARKTMRLSQNLRSVPQICFTPKKLSEFKVRKQPKPHCLSTIEAVHHTIELLSPHKGFDVNSRKHDHLLKVFSTVVNKQLDYVLNPRPGSYRQPRFVSSLKMSQPNFSILESPNP